MTYEEFKDEVKERILNYLGPEYVNAKVDIIEVTKNNDQIYESLHIIKPESKVIPAIRLKDFYQEYSDGMGMDSVLLEMVCTFLEAVRQKNTIFVFDMQDYKNIEDKLYIKVINKERNTKYLKDAFTRDVSGTDLVATVRFICGEVSEGTMESCLVDKKMLEMWGIEDDQVYERALRNTYEYFPVKLECMKDVLRELVGIENFEDSVEKKETSEETEIYVLTNSIKTEGAAVMLYPGVLQECAKKIEGDLLILPSSIHELLLIKDNGCLSIDNAQSMVMMINRAEVKTEDVLSDEVYRYDWGERKLMTATDRNQTKVLAERMEEMQGMDGYGEPLEEIEQELAR